jgi:long-chain acyl-CoA synthetase
VLAGGENVEPEPIETLIKTSPYVEQAVVVGQDRKNLGALLIPNQDCLEQAVPRSEWQPSDGWLQGKAVQALMRKELDRLVTRDNGCRPMERIAAFRVRLDPMTPENGLLTPTLKVKRHAVQAQFGAQIDGMFQGGGDD